MATFLDRDDERRRLERFMASDDARLAVVYGRRRCGKSTLLQRICRPSDVYFLADERETSQQLDALAGEIARVVPGFDVARYPTWDALLTSLSARNQRVTLFLDELPYLAAASPDLASVLQRHIDRPGPVSFVLCGSSQRMMQGLVLDRTAPLYGRATEILRVAPLSPGWIADALRVDGPAAVEAWATWGGVPRYWELARQFRTREDAVRDLVLDRNGVLHDEPRSVLLDDLRSASQASSILSLIGGGCRRLSEIAGRMGKPAGALTRPLANLIELGYVRKEVPFADHEHSKRTIYRIDDPFLAFWYRFVQPARSLLERRLIDVVESEISAAFPGFCADAWEALARESVPFLPIGGRRWRPASRWWAAGAPEVDVVAESVDGSAVLVGEVKWASRPDIGRWRAELAARVEGAPFVRGRSVVYALWVKEPSGAADVFGPDEVMAALRR